MRPAAEAERDVGIAVYVTQGAPCTALAKSRPGDFVVEEQVDISGLIQTVTPGYYPLYRVDKCQIDTLHMAEELAEALRSNVSYGGMKDKKAIATQYVTPTSVRALSPKVVERERFTASLVGYVPKPLSRGAVAGNTFDITLRDCCPEIEERIEEAYGLAKDRKLPNFYGLQRFGSSGAGTHRIGKAMVTGRFEEAVRVMLTEPGGKVDDTAQATKEAVEDGNYAAALELIPPGKDVERLMLKELSRHSADWVKALRAVPLKLRRLYVQAYQSAIFNRTLSRAIGEGEDISKLVKGDNWAEVSEDGLVTSRVMGVRDPPTARAVPMVQVVGYAFRDYGSRFDRHLSKVLDTERVKPSQFYLPEMQEVSGEGGFRRPHVAVKDPSSEVEGGTARLRFTLGRGQYATVLLREITKPTDPASAGLS